MEKQIKIVVKQVGQAGKVQTVKNEYETFNKIVGGYIEVVPMRNGVYMVCNEEGKLMGLSPNLVTVHDIIVGDVFFCSTKGDDFSSLSESQEQTVMEFLKVSSLGG